MSDLKITDSESDVNSNSSWTLLAEEKSPCKDEDSQSRTDDSIEVIDHPKLDDDAERKECQNPHEEQIETIDNLWPDDMDVESMSSSSSIESIHPLSQADDDKTVVQGCITFQEFLKEQELQKEYEFDEQASHWEQQLEKTKPRKKKYKKIRTDQVSTAKVVGAVLSLAGISFICMIAPYLTRQFITSDLENKLEKNFTKVDSQYAKSHGYEVYIDNSDDAKAVSQKPETLEALARQCCLTHINSKGKVTRKCTRCSREQSTTLQKFLSEATKEVKKERSSSTSLNREDKDFCVKGEVPSDEGSSKNDQFPKCKNQAFVSNKKPTRRITFKNDVNSKRVGKNDDDTDVTVEDEVVTKQPEKKKVLGEKLTEKKQTEKTPQKKLESKIALKKEVKKKLLPKTENTRIKKKSPDPGEELPKKTGLPPKKCPVKPKAEEKLMKPEQEPKKVIKKAEVVRKVKSETKDTKGAALKLQPKIQSTKSKCFIKPTNSDDTRMKNPINPKTSHEKKVKVRLGFSKMSLMEIQPEPKPKLKITPEAPEGTFKSHLQLYSKFENKQETANEVSKEKGSSKSNDESPQIPKFSQFRCDYMACQLLQDIALLRITGKLKAVVQKRQKKLKRRIEKRKLRLMKNATQESDSEDERKVRKPLKDSTTQKVSKARSVTITKKSSTNVFQRDEIKLNKSNVEFLKELPFGKEEDKLPAVYIENPRVKPHEGTSKRNMLYQMNLAQEVEASPDRNAAKSLAFLIELQKKREEKLKDLEEMKRENRMRIEAIIKERKSKLKKDSCLGYYNIPVPGYEDISEQLQKLKSRRSNHVGFLCESSDSDSEKTSCAFKTTENRVSAELMAALRVGKKVSDSFKEWTLKKAPTLTCLRNYCNSKVSQISERLSNSSAACNEKPSTNEDLECMRSRKERHEQLKKFWKAKQEYLDKRIEICNLLKDKLSGVSIGESSSAPESISQGVHILDSIIADVMKSVKSSKSLVNHAALEDNEVTRSCKSVCNMKNQMVCEASKSTNDDLYRWLFERKAMMIKKRDTTSFAATVRENLLGQAKREFSKQDPCRGYHERLLKKHN